MLCDWQLEVRKMYDPIDADNAYAVMEERIRRHLKQGPLTERELKRKLHRAIEKTGLWCFTKAMGNLKAEKEVYFKKDINEKTIRYYLSD